MNEPCWTLIPDYDSRLSKLDSNGCLKKYGHNDDHLHKLSNGKIIIWKDDPVPCHCCDDNRDECDESCKAFSYNEITTQKALILLNKSYEGNIPEEVKKILNKKAL